MPAPASRRKRVTPQTIIGEGGVALIAQRVNGMGFLYHDRRVDHGIDGEIELVGPGGEALNRIIMVQSKASNLRHSYETNDSFQWTADPADLDYWLSGNAPVIVVLSRPKDNEAWWFDVRTEFGDPRRRAERTVTIDKHTQVFGPSAAADIFRLGTPRDSGLFLASPPKKELLTSNLLPIDSWPDTLSIAPTTVNSYKEAWEKVKAAEGRCTDGWILHDGLLISFGELRTDPLRQLHDGGVERHNSSEWAFSNDGDTTHRFADLLRRTLLADRDRDLQWHQSRDHLHFRATRDLRARKEGRGQGHRGKTVFAPHFSKADETRVTYYHHAALRPRFRRIGDTWYCQLGIDYCFTRDGRTEASFADGLLAGIKRLDRHPAVHGWTLMWQRYLQGDLLTSDTRLTFGSLLTFEVDRGIDDNWWGPAPTQASAEDEAPARPDPKLEQQLNDAGVDHEDLLTLLEEPFMPPEKAPAPQHRPTRRR
ncbi:DUF4365 domain-containing protein [Streptosporangium saharense]|uniref:DUF4365 domain-containing protein n=1 Tax=Streptosporangium saharense TaxID=1706840 RepID=UPI0036BEAA8B